MTTDLLALSAEEWQRAKPLVAQLAHLPVTSRAEAMATALPNDPTLQAKLVAFLGVIDRASTPFDLVTPAVAHGVAAAVPNADGRLVPGETAGPYRVLRSLGAGGMGHVFLAEDTRLGRLVALKEMLAHVASDASRVREAREARAVAALHHPGIAALHDVIERPAGLLLVMEYVEGRSLSEIVASGPLPVREALRLTAEIADAIGYAHERGVVHCDIKPANVHVDVHGHPKVLDFGLAHLLAEGGWNDNRGDGQLFGTPHYMAPERLVKGSALPLCDTYSLGVLLFELLTGRVPFHGPADAQLFFDVLTTPPPPPSSLVLGLPREVDRIVERALAKSPTARFQSAREMASAARQVAAALEPDVSPVTGTALSRQHGRGRGLALTRRHGRLVLAAAAAALGFITFIGFVSTQVYNTAFGRTGHFDEPPWRWLVEGAEALIGPASYVVVFLVAGVMVWTALRLLAPGAVSRISRLAALTLRATPPRLAEGLLLASVAGLALFLWRFEPLIRAISGLSRAPWPLDLLPLRPGNRGEHVLYRMCSTLILMASAGAWLFILRRASERGTSIGAATLGAGAAVLLAATFLWAMPHQLVFQAKGLRVVSDGDVCYIIASHQGESLLFCPLAPPSERHVVVPTSGLPTEGKTPERVFAELDRLDGVKEALPR